MGTTRTGRIERLMGTVAMVMSVAVGCTGTLEEPGRTQGMVRLEGRVQLEVVEGPDIEETRVFLRDQATGMIYRLHFQAPPAPVWEPGDTYAVTGLREGREVLVEAYDRTEIAPSEEVAAVQHALHVQPRGERRVVVILADTAHLADDTHPAHPFPADIVDRVAETMWTGELSVNGLYETATNGTTTFPPDVNGDGRHDIYGPYYVPQEVADASHSDVIDFLDNAAIADGADYASYQHFLYVYSSQMGGNGLVGAATLGCDGWINGSYQGCRAQVFTWELEEVYAHELGHNLRLSHTDGRDDVLRSSVSLGYAGAGLNLFNAPHADELAAYQDFPEAALQLTEGGTFTVQALGTDANTGSHPFMLKFARPDRDENYYVSYRQPVGYDYDLRERGGYPYLDGAFVHIFPKDTVNCYVEDHIRYCPRPKAVGRYPMSDGESRDLGDAYDHWKDPDDGVPNGVVVTQLSHTGNTVTVSVTIPACGNGVCDANEACDTCETDCGACGVCGDGSCNESEDCASCEADCGACSYCGDGSCNADETCASCESDCGSCATCGDGACNGDESCSTCASDCGACPYCGDGTCNGAETCDSCSGDCGACACLAKDAWCTSDAECCSGKCRGRAGAQRCKGS